MHNVLITGGAGFIGSHLASALLARGHRVRILDSLTPQVHGPVPQGLTWLLDGTVDFMRGSVTQRDELAGALAGVDTVVHLAAETGTGQSMYEVARYNEVNSQGTALLFDLLANDPQRSVRNVVLASSRSVYGEGAYTCMACADGQRQYPGSRSAQQLAVHAWDPLCQRCKQPLQAVPTRETDPVRPASIYAATKYAQEDLVRVGTESLGLGHTILRLQNVYGEGQSLKNPYTGILSIFSTRIRRGIELPLFEDGLESRDFVHVSDVVRAMVACVERPEAANTIVNVGSGQASSVRQVAEELSRALCREPQVRVTAEYRIGDIRHNLADVSRLTSLLDCAPQVTLAMGLRRLADWVQSQALPEDLLARANTELRARKLMG